MRFRHPDGSLVHLGYCSNVHRTEDLDGIVAALGRWTGPVRERLGVARLGLGLWLAAPVARQLARDGSALGRVRAALAQHAVEVVSLNGFPYAAFSAEVVKGAVYHPDWTRPERLAYTADCAAALAGLLPDDVRDGSVSTLPLAWREPWDAPRATAARDGLAAAAQELRDLAERTGRTVRLGLEPEPGCVVETVEQAVRALDGLDTGVLGVCLDACHLAVAFEDPHESLCALAAAGIEVVKLQVAAALRVPDPAAERSRLAGYAEPRFLHQVRTARGALGADDLPEALGGAVPLTDEWRVHVHLPVHEAAGSTRDVLDGALAGLVGGATARTHHLEVETYTWPVLPGRGGEDLVAGLAAELDWTRARLRSLGLAEEP